MTPLAPPHRQNRPRQPKYGMAILDTAALLANLPDNTTGQIVAQNIRDIATSSYNRLDDSLATTAQAVPTGGTTGQVLSKSSSTDYATGWTTLPTITTTSTLYVDSAGNDSTAVVGQPAHPYLTVNAAIAAATSGDTIRVGIGTFAAPTNQKDGLTFIGSGLPRYNDPTTPTALTGGTIIAGGWNNTANYQCVYLMGFDVGSAYCTANSITGNDCMNFAGSYIKCAHVVALGNTSSTPYHSVKMEGGAVGDFEDLQTWGNDYSLVLKADSCRARGIRGANHSQGVVIKADGGQTTKNILVENCVMTDCGNCAIAIFANGGLVQDVAVSNVAFSGSGGVNVNGTIQGVVNLDKIVGSGGNYLLDTDGSTAVVILSNSCYYSGGFTANIRVSINVKCFSRNNYFLATGGWTALIYGTCFIEGYNYAQTGGLNWNSGGTTYVVNGILDVASTSGNALKSTYP